MADIFLSYARADQPRVEKLAAALEEAGYTLWWDKHLRGGHQFSEDIEAAIAEAKAVLVVWSADAVKSEWVRDEAAYGRDHNKLVPVRIDDTLPPMGYRQRHAINLDDADAMAALTEALDALIGGQHEALAIEIAAPSPKRKLALLALPLVALTGAAGLWTWSNMSESESGNTEANQANLSVAVLPFTVSGDAELNDIGGGLASSLSTGLGKLNGLQLISPTSTRALSEQNLTLEEIGERLNATHVVEGEIGGDGQELRLAVRLTEAATGRQIWQRSYAEPRARISTLHNRVGLDIAIALQVRLGVGDGRYAQGANVTPAAYEAYLRGLEAISARHNDTARREAVNQLRLATNIEPDFADAHAALAYLLTVTAGPEIGLSRSQVLAQEAEAIKRALQLDSSHPLARTAKHFVETREIEHLEQTLRDSRKVVEAAPNLAPAHFQLADILAQTNQYEIALGSFDRAMALDPYNEIVRIQRARAVIALGDISGVQQSAEACLFNCGRLVRLFYYAMLAHGDPQLLDRYWPEFERLFRQVGNPDNLPGLRELAETMVSQSASTAMIADNPFEDVRALFGDDISEDFLTAALAARSDDFEQALENMRQGLETFAIDINEILTDSRLTFTPKQRADPRYHAFFEDPRLKRLVAFRKAKGLMDGLPLAREEVAAEEVRLAAR